MTSEQRSRHHGFCTFTTPVYSATQEASPLAVDGRCWLGDGGSDMRSNGCKVQLQPGVALPAFSIEGSRYSYNLICDPGIYAAQVFPLRHLECFYEDEIERLLCGEGETWCADAQLHSKLDHNGAYAQHRLAAIAMLVTAVCLQLFRSSADHACARSWLWTSAGWSCAPCLISRV